MVATAKPDGNTFMSADNAILAFNEHLFSCRSTREKDFTYRWHQPLPLALVVNPRGADAERLPSLTPRQPYKAQLPPHR